MEWPEKVYVDEFPNNHFQTLCNRFHNRVEGSNVYLRADLVAARELEIVRATLKSIRKLLPGTQVFFDLIEPQDILKELEKK